MRKNTIEYSKARDNPNALVKAKCEHQIRDKAGGGMRQCSSWALNVVDPDGSRRCITHSNSEKAREMRSVAGKSRAANRRARRERRLRGDGYDPGEAVKAEWPDALDLSNVDNQTKWKEAIIRNLNSGAIDDTRANTLRALVESGGKGRPPDDPDKSGGIEDRLLEIMMSLEEK